MSAPAARLLSWVEARYPWVYPVWPFATACESSATDLESLGISRSRMTIIPLGVDADRFAPGARSSRPTLVYFGGLKAYKRPDHAVRALAELKARGLDCRLTMVGDGPMRGPLQNLVEELGVRDAVEFTGRLSDDDLCQTVRRSWVNLHCSVAEGWCLSALEAAAAGVPTAAYDVVGVRDTVRVGESGLLTPEGDVTRLAESVRTLLAERARYRESARAWALQFPWSRTGDAWREYLRRLS